MFGQEKGNGRKYTESVPQHRGTGGMLAIAMGNACRSSIISAWDDSIAETARNRPSVIADVGRVMLLPLARLQRLAVRASLLIASSVPPASARRKCVARGEIKYPWKVLPSGNLQKTKEKTGLHQLFARVC